MKPKTLRPLLPLSFATLALVAAQDVEPAGGDGPWIYFDGVEDGRLVGGRVRPQPGNPQHVPVAGSFLESARGSSVTTIVDNGPSSNRIDVVILGDGYTAGQLSTYATHTASAVSGLFLEEPFAEYASLFNVHRVDVVSNESGVDNDPSQGVLRDTALDMGFWCSGIERLLCVNVGAAVAQAGNAPDVQQILVLANSSKYGGAGYPTNDLGTLAGGNGLALEIALHEFGHSFGNLADEYVYAGADAYSGPELTTLNQSILDQPTMAADQKKWYRWFGTGGVGTFEGTGNHSSGAYRPTSNSLMRSLGRPFEVVNREALIAQMWREVDPIDDATPEGTYAKDAVFSVTPLHPSGHDLDVQWALDGVDIPGATGETFDAATLALGPGTFNLRVEVIDNTTWVRREGQRQGLMREVRNYTLSDVASAQLIGCGINPVGSLTILGGAPSLSGAVTFGVDNPLGFHVAGSFAFLRLAQAPLPNLPCGIPLAGFGMSPGQPGELLVDPATNLDPLMIALYAGQGVPTPFVVPIPADPNLLGARFYVQGGLADLTATLGVRIGLADGAELQIGL